MDDLTAKVGDSPDTLIATVEESLEELEATVGEVPETLIATVEDC
jgi:hypothetical protein